MPTIQKGYTLSEIFEMMEFMEKLIRNPVTYPREDFVKFHDENPWSLKYVQDGFAEAEHLREMAKSQEFKISFMEMSEKEKKAREANNLNTKQVTFITPQELGRMFVFRFECRHDCTYYPLNG